MKKKEENSKQIFDSLIYRYPKLKSCADEIKKAYEFFLESYRNGGKMLIAGNGGSASDSEHIVGELMKSFRFNRKIALEDSNKLSSLFGADGMRLADTLEGCLPAIPLTSMPALSSAYLNDVDPLMVFAQLLYGYGNDKDVFLGITTSGNSKNIINAGMVAKMRGIKTIALTGENRAKVDDYFDVVIHVPSKETYQIQELHLPIYHALCAMLEADFFEEK